MTRLARRLLPVVIAVLAAAAGCGCAAHPAALYAEGAEIVDAIERPSAEEAEEATAALRAAIARAEAHEDRFRIDTHDASAFVIPLSHLALARLAARFEQIDRVEASCWDAIAAADESLGQHLRIGGDREVPFASYAVFFRREKVRRQAFLLLKEVYVRAGERDLEALMDAEVSQSNLYLASETAREEERLVREAEASDWERRYREDVAGVSHAVTTTYLFAATAAAAAGGAMAAKRYDEKAASASTPAARAYFRHRAAETRIATAITVARMGEVIAAEQVRYEAQVHAIGVSFEASFRCAVAANQRLLALSPEVANLPEHAELVRRKEALDGYVSRNPFDRTAAARLRDFREAMDDLARAAQRRRRERSGQ